MVKILPNCLTIFRMFCPVFLFYTITRGQNLATLIIFLIAAISDFLDGYLARKFNVSTRIGAILDPLADKILVTFSYVIFCVSGDISRVCTTIVVGRDVLILLAVLTMFILKFKIKFKPIYLSKVNTALQLLLITVLIVAKCLGLNIAYLIDIFSIVVIVSTVASGALYLLKIRQFIR